MLCGKILKIYLLSVKPHPIKTTNVKEMKLYCLKRRRGSHKRKTGGGFSRSIRISERTTHTPKWFFFSVFPLPFSMHFFLIFHIWKSAEKLMERILCACILWCSLKITLLQRDFVHWLSVTSNVVYQHVWKNPQFCFSSHSCHRFSLWIDGWSMMFFVFSWFLTKKILQIWFCYNRHIYIPISFRFLRAFYVVLNFWMKN